MSSLGPLESIELDDVEIGDYLVVTYFVERNERESLDGEVVYTKPFDHDSRRLAHVTVEGAVRFRLLFGRGVLELTPDDGANPYRGKDYYLERVHEPVTDGGIAPAREEPLARQERSRQTRKPP